MTKWDHDDVRSIYKRAENAEARAEEAEVAVAELKARIKTLNSRIHPGDPDLIPNLERERGEALAEVERLQDQSWTFARERKEAMDRVETERQRRLREEADVARLEEGQCSCGSLLSGYLQAGKCIDSACAEHGYEAVQHLERHRAALQAIINYLSVPAVKEDGWAICASRVLGVATHAVLKAENKPDAYFYENGQ